MKDDIKILLSSQNSTHDHPRVDHSNIKLFENENFPRNRKFRTVHQWSQSTILLMYLL